MSGLFLFLQHHGQDDIPKLTAPFIELQLVLASDDWGDFIFMKANELRIGNIIQQGTIDLLEVRSIDGVAEISCVRCNGSSISSPEPETLTEEWLMKFGFERQPDRSFMQRHNSIKVTLFGVSWIGMDQTINTNVNSVHKLQNLYFALTGEELKLTQ